MVRQFRYPFKEEVLEIPAGKLDRGEDPFECAKRELSEETGCTSENFIDLGKIYPSPGYCSEILYLYLAMDLKRGEMHLDENELLSVEEIDIDVLIDMIMDDRIIDAKTVAGILKAKIYLENQK
jgi:ADP-ribose pyrophosphatase